MTDIWQRLYKALHSDECRSPNWEQVYVQWFQQHSISSLPFSYYQSTVLRQLYQYNHLSFSHDTIIGHLWQRSDIDIAMLLYLFLESQFQDTFADANYTNLVPILIDGIHQSKQNWRLFCHDKHPYICLYTVILEIAMTPSASLRTRLGAIRLVSAVYYRWCSESKEQKDMDHTAFIEALGLQFLQTIITSPFSTYSTELFYAAQNVAVSLFRILVTFWTQNTRLVWPYRSSEYSIDASESSEITMATLRDMKTQSLYMTWVLPYVISEAGSVDEHTCKREWDALFEKREECWHLWLVITVGRAIRTVMKNRMQNMGSEEDEPRINILPSIICQLGRLFYRNDLNQDSAHMGFDQWIVYVKSIPSDVLAYTANKRMAQQSMTDAFGCGLLSLYVDVDHTSLLQYRDLSDAIIDIFTSNMSEEDTDMSDGNSPYMYINPRLYKLVYAKLVGLSFMIRKPEEYEKILNNPNVRETMNDSNFPWTSVIKTIYDAGSHYSGFQNQLVIELPTIYIIMTTFYKPIHTVFLSQPHILWVSCILPYFEKATMLNREYGEYTWPMFFEMMKQYYPSLSLLTPSVIQTLWQEWPKKRVLQLLHSLVNHNVVLNDYIILSLYNETTYDYFNATGSIDDILSRRKTRFKLMAELLGIGFEFVTTDTYHTIITNLTNQERNVDSKNMHQWIKVSENGDQENVSNLRKDQYYGDIRMITMFYNLVTGYNLNKKQILPNQPNIIIVEGHVHSTPAGIWPQSMLENKKWPIAEVIVSESTPRDIRNKIFQQAYDRITKHVHFPPLQLARCHIHAICHRPSSSSNTNDTNDTVAVLTDENTLSWQVKSIEEEMELKTRYDLPGCIFCSEDDIDRITPQFGPYDQACRPKHVITIGPCSHSYHAGCFAHYLEKTVDRENVEKWPNCPECRQSIDFVYMY